jgi:hypothetical protein
MVTRKRFSKGSMGGQEKGEVRAILIASAGMGEFRNHTQRMEIRRGQERR